MPTRLPCQTLVVVPSQNNEWHSSVSVFHGKMGSSLFKNGERYNLAVKTLWIPSPGPFTYRQYQSLAIHHVNVGTGLPACSPCCGLHTRIWLLNSMGSYQTDAEESKSITVGIHLHGVGRDLRESYHWHCGVAVPEWKARTDVSPHIH